MDIHVNTNVVRRRGKNKQKWTMVEDDELINALHELSLNPRWKGEGSFKNGYSAVIESILAKRLPGCSITANPHIESRVRYFRTKYGALEVMLSRSGFTWDSNRNMLQCEKQQYEDHCQKHNEARGFYGVPFPYFKKLAVIYSKDIATGQGAEGFGEGITTLESEAVMESTGNDEDDRMSRETPRKSMDSLSNDTTSSKKQRRDNGPRRETATSDPFISMLGDVNGQLKFVTQNVGKMTTAMEREAIIQEKAMQEEPQQKFKEKAINELVKLGFTGTEIVNAATIFAKALEQMHMMFALPETLRREYVVKMLKDEENRR